MSDSIPVAPSEAIEEMEPYCVEHDGVPYCLVKSGDQINAFVSICTHKDLAMFPPQVKKGMLVCPHHKVAFDPVTGSVLKGRGKSVEDLVKVEIEILNGTIHLMARKKHRKIISKSERKWVEKEGEKLEKRREREDEVRAE